MEAEIGGKEACEEARAMLPTQNVGWEAGVRSKLV